MIEVFGLGVLPEHLLSRYQDRIVLADILAGGARQLTRFSEVQAEKIPLRGSLTSWLERIEQADLDGKRVAVLADGDPLLYGIGKTLVDRLGGSAVRIFPGLSVAQVAAAALHIPMTGLCTVSLHGRFDYAPLFAALTHHDHVGVYTDGVNDPAVLARGVLERDVSGFAMHIFEDLGMDSERIRCLEPEEAAREQFSSLSFVIFERRTRSAHALHFGMSDALFEREKGLITKGPVRAVGLAALELRQDSVLWDLGAGCGSVGIEAASVIRTGRVVAVERKPSRIDLVKENRARTGAWLMDAVCAHLPEGLDDLPDPDRVFMGGGVGTPGVVEGVLDRLAPGGILVANVVLLESLYTLMDRGRERGWEVRVTQVCASQSAPLGDGIRLQGLNPVFVIAVHKPKQEGCNA